MSAINRRQAVSAINTRLDYFRGRSLSNPHYRDGDHLLHLLGSEREYAGRVGDSDQGELLDRAIVATNEWLRDGGDELWLAAVKRVDEVLSFRNERWRSRREEWENRWPQALQESTELLRWADPARADALPGEELTRAAAELATAVLSGESVEDLAEKWKDWRGSVKPADFVKSMQGLRTQVRG